MVPVTGTGTGTYEKVPVTGTLSRLSGTTGTGTGTFEKVPVTGTGTSTCNNHRHRHL